jgi:hypothetical protein
MGKMRRGWAGRNNVEGLLGSPLLERLELLDLGATRLQASGAALVTSCPRLTRLRFLDLATCSLGDEGARALAGSPHLGNLLGLDLMQNRLTDNGVQALADALGLPRLTWQPLRLNKLTAGVAKRCCAGGPARGPISTLPTPPCPRRWRPSYRPRSRDDRLASASCQGSSLVSALHDRYNSTAFSRR